MMCMICWMRIRCRPIAAANSAGVPESTRWPLASRRSCKIGIVRDRPHVGGDPVTQLGRHVAPAEQARQALDFHLRKARFRDGRHIRQHSLALRTGHGENTRLARADRSSEGVQRIAQHMHAAFTQISLWCCSIPVRDMHHIELMPPHRSGEGEVRQAWSRAPRQFAGLRSGQRRRDPSAIAQTRCPSPR